MFSEYRGARNIPETLTRLSVRNLLISRILKASASHDRHMKIKKVLYLTQLEIGCFVAKQYQLVALQNR
jgi:hypothetical protein